MFSQSVIRWHDRPIVSRIQLKGEQCRLKLFPLDIPLYSFGNIAAEDGPKATPKVRLLPVHTTVEKPNDMLGFEIQAFQASTGDDSNVAAFHSQYVP